MPTYFFHLTFELYPSRSSSEKTFTPPPQTDIFNSELPAHRRASWGAYPSPSPTTHTYSGPSTSRDQRTTSHRLSQRTRPSFSDHHESPVPVVKPPKRPAHRRTQSFAHKDWRFDTISIHSIDMKPVDDTDLAQSRAKSLKHPSHASNTGGLATKGKFIPSDVKDTDVGWGVVHLYRDGQETPGLYDEVDRGNKTFNEEDCTTLCILAVPSYMTPSDFLGFMGEQTREHVSHFRLIRTSRANKYMVLMKFREAKRAREWRKEWDGKPFNSMEVSQLCLNKIVASQWLMEISQNTAMSFSSSRSTSRMVTRTATQLRIQISQTTPLHLLQLSSPQPLSRQQQVFLHLLMALR